MSEIESLQTFFLGMMTIFGGIAATFGIFILKKLDCFQTMFRENGERIAKLETARDIFHGKRQT